MKCSRFIPVCTTSAILLSSLAYADQLEKEFKLCAAAVLGNRIDTETQFQYDFSDLDLYQATPSAKAEEDKLTFVSLEMELLDVRTGDSLGDVRCYLTNTGLLVGAEFVKIYPTLASK